MGEVEVESIRLKGFQISDVLEEGFLKEVKEIKEGLNPIALVFVDETTKPFSLITLNHQSPKEIEDKIVHINSPNQEILTKISEIMKGKKKS